LLDFTSMKTVSQVTIGIDLGNRTHSVCVLNSEGEIELEDTIGSDRIALKELSKKFPQVFMVM